MSISLSLASINERAPYTVQSLNGYTFIFRTRFGGQYEVGFAEDYMLSDDGLVFQFFISNDNKTPSPRDKDLYLTVVAILEEFFKHSDLSVVYICDQHDGRQSVRQRLFSIWFSYYPDKNHYELITKTLSIDDIDYSVNLLIRRDSPFVADRKTALESLYHVLESK